MLVFVLVVVSRLVRSRSWQSIRNHDQGKKHVEIVEEFFRKKREDKLKGAQSESDLARQMERIEKVKIRGYVQARFFFFGGGGGRIDTQLLLLLVLVSVSALVLVLVLALVSGLLFVKDACLLCFMHAPSTGAVSYTHLTLPTILLV